MAAEKPILYNRGASHDPKHFMLKPDEENSTPKIYMILADNLRISTTMRPEPLCLNLITKRGGPFKF